MLCSQRGGWKFRHLRHEDGGLRHDEGVRHALRGCSDGPVLVQVLPRGAVGLRWVFGRLQGSSQNAYLVQVAQDLLTNNTGYEISYVVVQFELDQLEHRCFFLPLVA